MGACDAVGARNTLCTRDTLDTRGDKGCKYSCNYDGRSLHISMYYQRKKYSAQLIVGTTHCRHKSLSGQIIVGADHCRGREFSAQVIAGAKIIRYKSLPGQILFGTSHCLHKYIQNHSGGQQPNTRNCRISFRAQRTFIFDIQMFCNCLANRGNSYICNPRHIV